MKNKNSTYILSGLLVMITGPTHAIISFGDGLNTTASISGTTTTFTTTFYNGGTGSAGTGHGTTSTFLGGTYDGDFFDNKVLSDSDLTTRLHVDSARSVSRSPNGVINEDVPFENFIGLHVSFSAEIELFTFGMVDLDGNPNNNGEWAASYALNSVSNSEILPDVGFASTTLLAETTINTTGLNFGANAPSSIPAAILTTSISNVDPDAPANQVTFDFGGALVTDLYFAFGVQGSVLATSSSQNSGVTGIAVIEAVPEASFFTMAPFALCLAIGFKRRRN